MRSGRVRSGRGGDGSEGQTRMGSGTGYTAGCVTSSNYSPRTSASGQSKGLAVLRAYVLESGITAKCKGRAMSRGGGAMRWRA